MSIKINNSISYAEVHGEIVLSNIETGLYFKIGGSGKYIWEALVRGDKVDAIIDTLIARYQVDEHTVSKDVHEFLTDLEHHKFIQMGDEKNAT